MKRIVEIEIVCPCCRYQFSDNYERDDDGVLECPNCDKPFRYTRDVTISYTMEALKREKCPSCGKYEVLNNYYSSIGSVDEKLCEICLGVAIHKLKRKYIKGLENQ